MIKIVQEIFILRYRASLLDASDEYYSTKSYLIPNRTTNPRLCPAFSIQIRYEGIRDPNSPTRGFCWSLYFDSKSLAWRFRVMDGNRTTSPSRSLVMITWQPNREVSVSPKARSNMSFSSSDGSSILSKVSGSSTITWHVEQAQDPPHAPVPEIMSDIWN